MKICIIYSLKSELYIKNTFLKRENQKAEVNMHALLSPLHFLLCIRNNIRLVFGRLYRLVLLCKKRTLFSEIATDRGI